GTRLPAPSPSHAFGAGPSLSHGAGEGGAPLAAAGREQCKALVGVENPTLDVIDDLRLPSQRVHCAAEAYPIEELLLAGILDLGSREFAPARQFAGGEFVETRPVAVVVRVEVVVFRGQEGVRPAR